MTVNSTLNWSCIIYPRYIASWIHFFLVLFRARVKVTKPAPAFAFCLFTPFDSWKRSLSDWSSLPESLVCCLPGSKKEKKNQKRHPEMDAYVLEVCNHWNNEVTTGAMTNLGAFIRHGHSSHRFPEKKESFYRIIFKIAISENKVVFTGAH